MNLRPLACLWLGLSISLAAPDDQAAVRVRFRALAFDDPIRGASYLDGEELRKVDIPNNAFTRQFSYAGGRTLRFVTIDHDTLNPQPLSPDMQAATQRLRRAQAMTLQASEEYAQIRKLLDNLGQQASEKPKGMTEGDRARNTALNERLRQLSDILLAAAKETEETNLQIMRLESSPKPAQPKKGAKAPRPQSTPTAECTFPKDGDYLLLFSSAGNGHQIMMLDDSEGAFPYGSFQFVNLTGKDVEIRLEGRKSSLRPNTRAVLRNPAPDHAYFLAEIHTRDADGFDLGHSLRGLQDPATRSLVFLLPLPDEAHAVRSRTIEDRRPAGPKDGK
jgi:hypothetical protein